MRSYLLILFTFASVLGVHSETEEARKALSAILAKYANLSAFYVEGIQESTTTDEIEHNWEQERFTVAKVSGNRYHYDIKSPGRWNVVVSDGITEWDFQPWRNEYTKRPVPNSEPDADNPDDVIRYVAAKGGERYVEELSQNRIRAAEFLPPETLTVGGKQVACDVIRARYESLDNAAQSAQLTFWIEKERKVIRKQTVVNIISPSVLQSLRKVKSISTTIYTTVNLDGQPPASLFNFSPPSGARQVRRLFFDDRSIDLTGFPAPPLKLSTLDGEPFDPNSVKGHVILVDFWASWCAPCVQQMRSLAKLADDFSKQGLMVVGIDWGNDDPNAAREFLKKNHYGWTNLRGDSETANAWMLNEVPLVALIDPVGNIAYYHSGYEQPEETAIVAALQKINPSFRNAALCEQSTRPQ